MFSNYNYVMTDYTCWLNIYIFVYRLALDCYRQVLAYFFWSVFMSLNYSFMNLIFMSRYLENCLFCSMFFCVFIGFVYILHKHVFDYMVFQWKAWVIIIICFIITYLTKILFKIVTTSIIQIHKIFYMTSNCILFHK